MKKLLFLLSLLLLTSVAKSATMNITVKNVNGSTISGAKVVLYSSDWSTIINTVKTNSYGIASFNNLNYGTYNYEAYYDGGNGEEFWGGSSVKVNSANVNVTFTRSEPWASATSVPTGNYNLGASVPMSVTIKNSFSSSENVKVRLVVDKDKGTPYDFDQKLPESYRR